MNHVEWEDHAGDLHVAVLTKAQATADLDPDDEVYEPFVLVLSSGGGGTLAVGGTRESLLMLADKIRARIDRMTRAAVVEGSVIGAEPALPRAGAK